MLRKLLDHNPLTGESVVFEADGAKVTLTHEQNVESILDANKRLANDQSASRKGIKNEMWHYATIPNVVALKWKLELGVDIFDPSHRKAMFRLLNQPEYAYLKTTTLKHGG